MDSIPPEVASKFSETGELDSQLQSAINQSLLAHGIDDAEISVAVVGDRQIHEINRQYLDHDYETDVITFDLGNHPESGAKQGEIVVSAETASRLAGELGVCTTTELILYAVHGALHLSGFDDRCDQDRVEMRNAEKKMMTQLGYEYKFEAEDDSDQ